MAVFKRVFAIPLVTGRFEKQLVSNPTLSATLASPAQKAELKSGPGCGS